ncbi:hypothetical protein RE6C_02889 [Rhodopirellula europaea 6C]|uniref:Uncharacterized protein n=1 Tax=Rhodopirellula europaea 6C TaxID=1263867 RepID=M2B2V3_9BACT|nr:hypothetical protein RE6C_02889 [Rhodopirellula europaea 6C]
MPDLKPLYQIACLLISQIGTLVVLEKQQPTNDPKATSHAP